ncbi:hypothetical protein DPMN_156610 [Dreissena polymorpha]|uniref:Uncharacterized protein n=1 Tax=Dreissena polymorpha TaxID=45954 RepID=A0A9D4FQ34_DREPO|nr:hypothetical protein DPMN_156610 [Dreissena polymorpha]
MIHLQIQANVIEIGYWKLRKHDVVIIIRYVVLPTLPKASPTFAHKGSDIVAVN